MLHNAHLVESPLVVCPFPHFSTNAPLIFSEDSEIVLVQKHTVDVIDVFILNALCFCIYNYFSYLALLFRCCICFHLNNLDT